MPDPAEPLGRIPIPDMKPDTSAEDLAQVLASHATQMWGAPKAEALQDSLAQTARTLLEIRQQLPGLDTEPGCYPAAESSESAAQ